MIHHWKTSNRNVEAINLIVVFLVTALGFLLVSAGVSVQEEANLESFLPGALAAPLIVGFTFGALHVLLRIRGVNTEQVLIPLVGLIFSLGLIMIWRLRGWEGVQQQLIRGFLPGMAVIFFLSSRPMWIERLRRWAIPASVVGLGLPIATAIFGVVDETGSRLALKLGPLPAIQTSEIIKLALVLFLAWYIEKEGKEAEGRAVPLLGWLRLPAIRYFIPGALFAGIGTLALVEMQDFGAVMILAFLFVGMIYAGFETRIFLTVGAIGLILVVVIGVGLNFFWDIPTVMRYRFIAYLDPWSQAVLAGGGGASGVTVSQGPGYQLQQSIYAVISGGVAGTGLGFGTPFYVPLAHSDFIFAALLEEMGAVVGFAVLFMFGVLLLRILRIALVLPEGQVFERLLLIGIGIHLFTQLFVMVAGTLNLIPVTGITIPFMSLGGAALLINFTEIGIVLALVQRIEGRTA